MLGAASLLVVVLSPTAAMAAPEDTFITFSGEGGDWVTQDLTWNYDRANANILTTGSTDNNRITVQIASDTFWSLNFAAPIGQALEPGIYEGATRFPFQSPGDPGLSLFGNGRGCNTSIGSYEVLEVIFGPHGFVERFHATFEQHCEGSLTSRAFGEILIDNGPAPEPLSLEVVLNDPAAVSKIGRVTLTGTVACSKPTLANVVVRVTQRVNRRLTTTADAFVGSIPCAPDAARDLLVALQPLPGLAPFNPGQAQVDVVVFGFDSDYGTDTRVETSTIIRLSRAQ
jgi:hypothetical protein